MGMSFQTIVENVQGVLGYLTWIFAMGVFCYNWNGSISDMHKNGFDVFLLAILIL
jgi:hypothetical protein